MKNVIPSFYETLSDAINACQLHLNEAQAELLLSGDRCGAECHWSQQGALKEPVKYGETRRADFEIFTLKGKQSKKWFHISIYRAETGRYELTAYVL